MLHALGEMMSRTFTEEEGSYFSQLIGWEEDDWLDFRTWCGVCALCERIMGNAPLQQLTYYIYKILQVRC